MNIIQTIASEMSKYPDKVEQWESSFSNTVLVAALLTLSLLLL